MDHEPVETNPFKFQFHDGDLNHTVVVVESGAGMSVGLHMLNEQVKDVAKVVVIDVGLTSRGLVDLMRDGRKVNSSVVPSKKAEPYYRQYDKRQ